MQADDDDDDDNCGLFTDDTSAPANAAQKAAETRYAHFKTEIAFAHVKEHELVESSCSKGRLALGSANIELDLRV